VPSAGLAEGSAAGRRVSPPSLRARGLGVKNSPGRHRVPSVALLVARLARGGCLGIEAFKLVLGALARYPRETNEPDEAERPDPLALEGQAGGRAACATGCDAPDWTRRGPPGPRPHAHARRRTIGQPRPSRPWLLPAKSPRQQGRYIHRWRTRARALVRSPLKSPGAPTQSRRLPCLAYTAPAPAPAPARKLRKIAPGPFDCLRKPRARGGMKKTTRFGPRPAPSRARGVAKELVGPGPFGLERSPVSARQPRAPRARDREVCRNSPAARGPRARASLATNAPLRSSRPRGPRRATAGHSAPPWGRALRCSETGLATKPARPRPTALQPQPDPGAALDPGSVALAVAGLELVAVLAAVALAVLGRRRARRDPGAARPKGRS
jgi:hypothetical protein